MDYKHEFCHDNQLKHILQHTQSWDSDFPTESSVNTVQPTHPDIGTSISHITCE